MNSERQAVREKKCRDFIIADHILKARYFFRKKFSQEDRRLREYPAHLLFHAAGDLFAKTLKKL